MSSKTPIKVSVTVEASQYHGKEEILRQVETALTSFFANQNRRSYVLHPRYSELVETLKDLMLAGGKRNRPYLTVLAYEAYGGSQFEAICEVAAATEMLHLAMLVHDDIIDRDTLRYGVDNIAGSYLKAYEKLKPEHPDNQHQALSAALLGGDLLLSSAYETIANSGFSPPKILAMQRLLGEAVFRVIGGELAETNAILYPASETDPLNIAELKTAYYTFVLPLTAGAMLADAPEAELSQLKAFGLKLGVAYQLVDDLLGSFGDPKQTGKPADSDIREGKPNYLYRQALELSDDEQRKVLERYFGTPNLTAAQADNVRRVYIDCGARKAVLEKIQEYCTAARWHLDELNTRPGFKMALESMIEKSTNRVK